MASIAARDTRGTLSRTRRAMLAAMSDRQQRVRMETERHVIEGDVQMPAEGFRSRVTDFFNANGTEFVALTNAVVIPLEGAAAAAEHSFVAVSIRHVVMVVELDAS